MTVADKSSLDLHRIRISPLETKDSIRQFKCGEPEIDKWAKDKAYKFNNLDRSRVFIAHDIEGTKAMGYYALSLSNEKTSKLADINERDRYPDGFPVMYLQYIGVATSCQNCQLGTMMLMDALKRAYNVSKHVAFYGVGLRSLNKKTTNLYEKFGFGIAPDEVEHPLMVLPIWSIRDMVGDT